MEHVMTVSESHEGRRREKTERDNEADEEGTRKGKRNGGRDDGLSHVLFKWPQSVSSTKWN